jgi:hypothetical protein
MNQRLAIEDVCGLMITRKFRTWIKLAVFESFEPVYLKSNVHRVLHGFLWDTSSVREGNPFP